MNFQMKLELVDWKSLIIDENENRARFKRKGYEGNIGRYS